MPLLEGRLAEAAREIVDEIALELARRPPSPEPGLKGEAGTVLLLAQCGHPEAITRLEAALLAAVTRPLTISLFGGLAGISWVLDHLVDAGAALEHFEAALCRHLDVPRWEERFDLMSGLVGVGVLVSSRRTIRGRQLAERVLFHLEQSAIITDQGATWRTPPQFLPEARRAQFPNGMIDLGVAHGTPGVVGMLARFVEANIEVDRSRRLLDAAVSWLLHAVPPARPRYGTSWPDPEPTKRTGWCYGDAGVAGVLLRAARALNSPTIEATALGLLRDLATPSTQQTTPDASFCHGAAGLSHIYNVAYQLTGDDFMRRQAFRWLREILRMRRRPDAWLAGYCSLKLEFGSAHWATEPTLLSGAVGTALVLLAAIEDREPTWQRLFLL